MAIDPIRRPLHPSDTASLESIRKKEEEKAKALFAPSSSDLPKSAIDKKDELSLETKEAVRRQMPNAHLMATLIQEYFKRM